MFGTVVAVLTRPGEYFAAREEPSLRPAALAVAASALPKAAVGMLVLWQFRGVVPLPGLAVGAVVALAFVGVFAGLLWLVVAVLLYALSVPVAARDDRRRLFAFVGWGLAPQAVTGTILLLAAVAAVSQLPPPTDVPSAVEFGRRFAEGSLLSVATSAGTARATFTGSFSQVEAGLGLVGALWSGYVWTAAVEQARGVGRRRAVLVVAVPVLALALNG